MSLTYYDIRKIVNNEVTFFENMLEMTKRSDKIVRQRISYIEKESFIYYNTQELSNSKKNYYRCKNLEIYFPDEILNIIYLFL
jgi:hypothetical protein